MVHLSRIQIESIFANERLSKAARLVLNNLIDLAEQGVDPLLTPQQRKYKEFVAEMAKIAQTDTIKAIKECRAYLSANPEVLTVAKSKGFFETGNDLLGAKTFVQTIRDRNGTPALTNY